MTRQDTIELIIEECDNHSLYLDEQKAYVLGTVEWETNHTFKPVKEAYWKSESWRKRNLRYYPYYGRGAVQLTWQYNYEKFSEILGIDLVNNPDLAMDPYNSIYILVYGFKHGTFTGRKLETYVNIDKTDFYHARRCINGLNKATKIAKIAEDFLVTYF